MTLVTLSTTISDYTDVIWSFDQGVHHGRVMFLNAITLNSYFEYLDGMGIPLDAYVDDLVETNGGWYTAANVSAHVGAHALHAAGLVWAWGAAGGPTWSVAVGPGRPWGFHMISGSSPWGGGATTWTHFTGLRIGWNAGIIAEVSPTAAGSWFTIEGIPIFFPAAAISHPYCINCVTHTVHSLLSGLFRI
ncbi:MAG: hypothetical protein R3C19_24170 [Planctomycetaceae bacterium]